MERPWHQFYDEAVPKTFKYPEINLYQLLQMAVEENPRGRATIFFGAKLNYAQLARQVERFSEGLAAHGVGKGDRVALLLPNLPGYPIAHFGVLRIGGTLVPTNPLYVERELEHQLNDAGAETVVTLDPLYPKLEKVRSRTGVKRVIVMKIADFLPRLLSVLYGIKHKCQVETDESEGVFLYSDFIKKKYPRHPGAHVSPDDIALLLYTGGTTGVSKGAVLTHRNVVTNAYQVRNWLWSMTDREEILLCGLQEFVPGEMVDPWRLGSLVRLSKSVCPEGGDPGKFTEQVRANLRAFVTGVKKMILKGGHIPDLAGEGNLLLTFTGGIKLVDINNISKIIRAEEIYRDDNGYPVCDKSVEALSLLEKCASGEEPDMEDPTYRFFLDPERRAHVREMTLAFYQTLDDGFDKGFAADA